MLKCLIVLVTSVLQSNLIQETLFSSQDYRPVPEASHLLDKLINAARLRLKFRQFFPAVFF